MDDPTKRNILFVIVVGSAIGAIAFFGQDYAGGGVTISPDATRPSATVEGEVLAIETVSRGSAPERKEAVVKLGTAKLSGAYVPPACILFTGQIAKLSRFGDGVAKSLYVVKEAREKNGS